jgi:hypothetical protein
VVGASQSRMTWIFVGSTCTPPLINNKSQILNLGHAKSAFLQIGTQLVFPQCLEDLSDVVEVLFPSLDEDQNAIQVHHYK